jgi:hypothetical protein
MGFDQGDRNGLRRASPRLQPVVLSGARRVFGKLRQLARLTPITSGSDTGFCTVFFASEAAGEVIFFLRCQSGYREGLRHMLTLATLSQVRRFIIGIQAIWDGNYRRSRMKIFDYLDASNTSYSVSEHRRYLRK